MHKNNKFTLIASCHCAKVSLAIRDAAIMSVACYCTSCREAGTQLQALPDAATILAADESTAYVMYRKDRVDCKQGHEFLREHRLNPESTTRRVIATCCNSAMFLEFKGGHWLSIYTNRLAPNDRPAIRMRTMTRDSKAGIEFTDGIPSPKRLSMRLMWPLLCAWIAMGFRAPKIDYISGTLEIETGPTNDY
jgi:hypothetical protein